MECIEMIKSELLGHMEEWQWAKSHVYPIMRPVKENMEDYGDMPDTEFLNLKVYYKVLYPMGRGSMATVKITNGMLKMWGISETELQENAMQNMKDDGYRICDMMSVIRGMFGEAEETGTADLKADMYVMLNQNRTEGAAGMLHIGLIQKFAEDRGTDLYILPSSIQEIILIPFDKKNSPEMLKEMVTEINQTQVEEEEQLGNSIYAYSRESGVIYIAS